VTDDPIVVRDKNERKLVPMVNGDAVKPGPMMTHRGCTSGKGDTIECAKSFARDGLRRL
jgi:hypothetical protein